MNPNDNEQTELLRLIWTEMKALGQNLGTRIDRTNERLEATNERLDSLRVELKSEIAQTNLRLDSTNEHLDATNHRLDHTNERLGAVEGALRDLATQQLMLGRYVKNASERQGIAVDELRDRVTRIETKLEIKER